MLIGVPAFIKKVFCLVSIRNCVMHCNSLEVLIRFYKPKTHELRNSSDRKKYLSLIKLLSKEKLVTKITSFLPHRVPFTYFILFKTLIKSIDFVKIIYK